MTGEQDLLRATARAALEKMFPSRDALRRLDGELVQPPWGQLGALGWFEAGEFADHAVILEEMGRVLAPAGYAATVCGAIPVLAALGEERFLAPMLTGEGTGVLVADGMVADGTRFSGDAGPVAGAAGASTLVVAATGDGGIEVACVATDAPGVSIVPVRGLDPTAELARVALDGVVVLADAVVGRGAPAAAAVGGATDRLALAAVVELCGAGAWMLDAAVEYAKTREQFGKPIGSFQAIKHMCADMLVRLEASRAAVQHAVRQVAANADDASVAVSVAKAFAAENIGLLAEDALQVHGGIGFTWEHPIHLYVRRAASVARLFGSGDMHRERVAVAIGL